MITQERKSKFKHKITFTTENHRRDEIHAWLYDTFGEGGRSRKLRWRYGWTQKDQCYYFKSSKDAMMFTLRWAS
jgi:hypothetical protein